MKNSATKIAIHAITDDPPVAARRCPCCMSTVSKWRPIVYGPVDKTVVAQARRGEVLLGGLNHGRNEPRWQCTRCETRFGRPRQERDRFGKLVGAVEAEVKATPTWRLMKTMRLPVLPTRTAA